MNLVSTRDGCSVDVDGMSDSGDIRGQILRIFLENLNIEVASADTDLIDGGLLDSLTLVNLLAHLEKEFGLVVPIEDLEVDNFRSARRIAELVMKMRTPES